VADQKKSKDKSKDKPKEKPPAPPTSTDAGWLDPPAGEDPSRLGESLLGEDLDLSNVDFLFNQPEGEKEEKTGSDLPAGIRAEISDPPPLEEDVPPPPPVEAGDSSVLDDKATFRAQAQTLAKRGDWPGLAALTQAALDVSKWASQPEIRAALLSDLARVYRDRLRDLPSAEDQFRRLVELVPANAEAHRFLAQRFREREDWTALYQLRAKGVEATWDPNQRLEWTREAALVAKERLRSDDLAVEAWERLWALGEAQEEVPRALSDAYRRGGRWDRLAKFLGQRAEGLKGAERIAALREIAEAQLSGVRDHDAAAPIVEQILGERPNDPVALLAQARVLARRKDWRALTDLGTRKLEIDPQAAIDVRRLAANALWSADEHERAAQVYEQILAALPNDPEALKAKEEVLVRQEKIGALVELLAKRAQAAPEAERAALYDRAATLAEKDLGDPKLAASLLEKRAEIESGRAETLQSLANTYETLADHEGLKRTLERLIAVTRNPQGRIDLRRRLGEHCAHRLGDDTSAERCWREILDAVPDDRGIRDELTALYRRRGDFEAVDRSLAAQAWRSLDDESLATVWRAAAVNIQENANDPSRSIRAWRRVLDVRPDDALALRALGPHARALGDRLALIDALEAEWRIGDEGRVERALEIARLWEAENDRAAALAAYERVLRLQAGERTALQAIARLGEAGSARGVLDLAAAELEGERGAVVRQALALAGSNERARFLGLRRVLGIEGASPQLLAEIAQAAREANAHAALAAIYEELAAAEADGAARVEAYRQLAALCEGPLGQPVRGFLIRQAARQRPVSSLSEIDPLLDLAEKTGRHEDAFALLGVAACADAPAEVRRQAIRRRMSLCEKQLGDPARAFHEAARLVRLDPRDAQALADAERLGAAAQLHDELDGLWAERWDRANSTSERVEIVRARKKLHAHELKDPHGALDHSLVEFRLQPSRDLEDELARQADALGAWDRVLPVMEANTRSAPSAEGLARLAALHEEKRKDRRRAFELYAQALLLEPGSKELEEKAAAAAGDGSQRLAALLRETAARSSDPLRALELYRRAAALYAGPLKHAELALDLHQRILQLQPAALESIEVVLEHQRSAGLSRELRDALQRWLELEATAGDPRRRERMLEIASLSRDKLGDSGTALQVWSKLLDLSAEDPAALQGIQSLTGGEMEPALELERLRIELTRSAGARRVEIQLACAKLQEVQLDDAAGAIATLRGLVAESGAAGAGYEPLAALLTKSGQFGELSDLMEQRSTALGEVRAKLDLLEQAVTLADQHHEVPADRRERVYRALLAASPSHAEARRRLMHLYRSQGRYEELEKLLAAGEGWPAVSERVRVLDRMLNKSAEAESLLAARMKAEPDNGEVILALASLQRKRGDKAGYLVLREKHARLLPPRLGALVLCHLAEVTDETLHDTEKVLAFYRAARALDPENRPAMEGLKALGRRSRGWRAQAALLADPDESQLGAVERAARLLEKGRAVEMTDLDAALGFFERAVAVNPDEAGGWDALAAIHQRRGDHASSLAARKGALGAFERTVAPEPSSLAQHAERLQRLAVAAKSAGDAAAALAFSQRAYELEPELAEAALAVADARLADGATDEAQAIYAGVLQRGKLGDEERRHARWRSGELAQRNGKIEEAIVHLRDGLRVAPLDPELLQALADVLAGKGWSAAAAQHYLQALLLAADAPARGQLYAHLGKLWETSLANPDEAGVCYDFSLGCGVEQPEIMMRALAYYRRSGKKERAAKVIEHLLPRTTAPSELATLWAERGALLADTEQGKAMEAFDMALSYDPACRPAVDGLASLLEKRGEWQQLVELLEVRLDGAEPAARAATLRTLARISNDHLRDPERAELYLRGVLDLDPTLADYDRLLDLVGESEPARREILAQRLTLGGPWMPYLIEFGQKLASAGHRGWAWCLLSPLMNAMIPDPQVKTLVLELRKEFDKAENVGALTPELHRRVLDRALPGPLYDILAELDAVLQIGPRTPEEAGAGRGSRVDAKVALGKMFASVAERLGLKDALLTRSDELPVPYRVLQGGAPHIVARTDLFAVMSLQETNALFSLMLEQARPGARLLTAGDPAAATRLCRALLAAVGLRPRDPEIEALAAQIEAATNESQRAMWQEQLRVVEGGCERIHDGLVQTARHVAVIAAGELRFAAKILARLEEGAPKLPTAGRIEDLETFFAASPTIRNAIAFAASPGFGELLSR
jgi:tetratricopeptide (TPR) repeat protein